LTAPSQIPEAEIQAAAEVIERWKRLGAHLLESDVYQSRQAGEKMLGEAKRMTPFMLASQVWRAWKEGLKSR